MTIVMGTAVGKPRITLNNVPEAYLRFDSDFRCTFANEAALQLLDLSHAEIVGTSLWTFFGISIETSEKRQLRRVMADRIVSTFEHRDASTHRDYSVTAMPDLMSDGILVRFSRDVEQNAIKLHKLRENEELYRHVFEVESDALVLFDTASGQILETGCLSVCLIAAQVRRFIRCFYGLLCDCTMDGWSTPFEQLANLLDRLIAGQLWQAG